MGYRHCMSFDMFWPFFAPKTQIGYHTKVCGIVITRAYNEIFFYTTFCVGAYNGNTWMLSHDSRCVSLSMKFAISPAYRLQVFRFVDLE